ncbi:MAG: hypothetical protein ABR562_03880 [Thermoplasmatota archaeon]
MPNVRLPAPLVAGAGLVLLVGVIVYGALAHAPFRMAYLVTAALGVALQLVAPKLDRNVGSGVAGETTRRGRSWRLGSR